MATEEENNNKHTVESGSIRAEIDTSAPFESVKEAANRFGGMGFWKPSTTLKPLDNEFEHDEGNRADISKIEEEAAKLERDLITKERETLEVLKELESTKNIVEELKSKLQNETSEINAALNQSNLQNDKNETSNCTHQDGKDDGLNMCPSSSPGLILLELKQAKLNLTRTTNDLADIRATVDSYNKKIEKERLSLEKTRERLSLNTSKISCLEEEVNQTKQVLEQVKDTKSPRDPPDITKELQKLSSETKLFKEVGEAARAEVLRAMSEIEQTKTRIRTAEVRLIAAKKMKEAAKASEAVALYEIKAISNSQKTTVAADSSSDKNVTISYEEYSSLVTKAREAEEAYKNRVEAAMIQVDEANISKSEILKKVEEATEEVKISKKALEEALTRVEEANKGKLAVEEALRRWRSEHGHKRRAVHNNTKFKNSISSSSAHKRDTCLLDVNGLNLSNDELKPVASLKPTLSIGQILSRKLLLTEEYENGMGKRKVSLGQMLGSSKLGNNGNDLLNSGKKSGKENKEHVVPLKRKKFGFARISRLVTKQSKKKKMKQNASLMCGSVEI